MTSFYAFQVMSKDDVVFPEHYLQIGEGLNTFNLTVDDLDAFVAKLKANGVQILATYKLDDHEEIPPVTFDLALSLDNPADGPRLLSAQGSTSHDR